MVETTLAVGDLINAIPSLYYQLQMPVAVITLLVGALAGAFSLHKGVGKAAGKVVGGIALASLVFGGLSLAHSINATVNLHSGGGPVMVDTGYIP
jgi:sulfopyruvate decarboxylase TPP-binding subunit